MREAIGYNGQKINELMEAISTAYTNLAAKVTSNYETLKPVLRAEWVGEDELDFEKNLVNRLNELYYNAGYLSQAAVNAIRNVADSWKEFQSRNVLDMGTGSNSAGMVNINVSFTDVTITPTEGLIQFQSVDYADNIDRGLTNGTGSYSAIIGALETFKTKAETDAGAFTDEFDVNNAFFGGTETGINGFLEHVETSLGAVLTAVKDFVDGLNSLANSNWTTATSKVNEYTTSAKGEVDTLINDSIASTRWGASN